MEEKVEVEKISGKFKPKNKFLNFVIALKSRIRLNSDVAYIDGNQLSGMLDKSKFKIKIYADGSADIDEVEGNSTDEAMRMRLLTDISEGTVISYAEKFIISELKFYDEKRENPFYIEVESKKPIDRLFDIVNETSINEVSQNALSILDDLFSEEEEEEEEVLVKSEVIDDVILIEPKIIENPIVSALKKTNDAKVNELELKLINAINEVTRIKSDITNSDSKLKNKNEDIRLLRSRLESLIPNKQLNGWVFFVSESETIDIELTDDNKQLIDMMSKILKFDSDKMINLLKTKSFKVSLAKADSLEFDELDLELINNILDMNTEVDIKMVDNCEFIISGDVSWHQIVDNLLKLGFEQSPEFNKKMKSNSYISTEDSKIPEEVVGGSSQSVKI